MLHVILPVLSTSYCIFNLIPYEESEIFRFSEGIAGFNILQGSYHLNLPNAVILILPCLLLQYGVRKNQCSGKLR
jgi:hypothetical protein